MRVLALIVTVLFTLPACGQEEVRGKASPTLVFVISIDGLRPDAIDAARTPTLDALIEGGTRCEGARTIFPSSTLPSHTSMLTGLAPRHHRVYWNSLDRSKGRIEVPTCLDLVRQAGWRTAMFVAKEKLWHLAAGADRFEIGSDPAEILETAVTHAAALRPALTFVHLADPDRTGHAHGWMSPEQIEAIERVDAALAAGLALLEKNRLTPITTLLITSDHGGHGRTHGTWIDEDMLIPWIASGPTVRPGHTIAPGVETFDTAATVLHLLGIEVPEKWDGRPVREAFEGGEEGGG